MKIMKSTLFVLVLAFSLFANAVSVEYLLGQTDSTLSNQSAAYATSLVIKASPGRLYQLVGYNSKTSAQFIQLHDAVSLPADTAIPKMIWIVPASQNFSLDLPLGGKAFLNGIVVTNSSTGPTKTIGSADVWYSAEYK